MAQNEAQVTQTVGNEKKSSYFATIKDSLTNTQGISDALKSVVLFPQQNLGIAGYVFDIVNDYEVRMSASATPHYIENNSFVQDHIQLNPKIITLRGMVGEFVIKNKSTLNRIADVTQKLSLVAEYLPQVTSTIKRIKNLKIKDVSSPSSFLKTASTNTRDIYGLYQNITSALTKQGQAFQFFEAMRDARQIISFETPWKFYQNFYIKEFTSSRDENLPHKSDFTLVLEELRFATLEVIKLNKEEFQGRLANQKAEVQDKGEQSGKTKLISTIRKLF